MDYEKEYKDALERARGFHSVDENNTMKVYAKGTMEYLFPVLKESEDEKIRKEKTSPIQNGGYMSPEDKEKALEKQGHQNHNVNCLLSWSEKDEETLSRIRAIVRNDNSSRVEDILWLKSLKDRMKGE